VEWRAVLTFTGSQPAVALGRIVYQPILSNIDNAGAGQQIDDVGAFRDSLLSSAEGSSTASLATYGRVTYGTAPSTVYFAHRHTGGSNGAPPGSFLRVATTAGTQWYAPSGTGSPADSVRSENQNTFSLPGTQNLAIFRQAFLASFDEPSQPRTVNLTSEVGSMQGIAGSAFMTWAAQGESAATATIRVGVEFIPATITIVPAPGQGLICGAIALAALRRKRGNS
jgi:hypothetical protein